ncbi:MAG: hypothetical protein HPAVJP_2500 [Candidatus Hepatoplasma vulgare]|nr:MAG: hypothetical protein HPAVJP_2500 [Candidatus Hepatoplasma sp.]
MKNEKKILSIKRFSFVFIKESETNINYLGIEDKNKRPFLYLKKLSNDRYLFARMFTKKNNNYQNNAKNLFFIKTFDKKDAVINLSDLYIFSKNELIKSIGKNEKGEIKIENSFFPKKKKNELIHSLTLELVGEQNLNSYISFLNKKEKNY